MKTINLAYGRGRQYAEIDDERQVTVLQPGEAKAADGSSEREIIAAALAAPIASPPLEELARGKKRVVIITSDHTRPVPSRLTLPPMLAAVRKASPRAHISILIAVGSHRPTSRLEMVEKFGEDLVNSEEIINHDPHDPAALVCLGQLPSGGDLWLNRLVAEADLLLADGFIEPHQFAGFSGGRKSVLPGIAGLKTVLASHNAEFTVHPQARPGNLDGNPFQTDMLHAARAAGLAFILNVTLDRNKAVSAAFAGEVNAAHLAGCRHVTELCAVKAAPSPIVLTSNGGYPLDQNIYQAAKSIMTADLTCAEGGIIIAVNECSDGHGSEAFYQTFKRASSLDDLLAGIKARRRDETLPDQWVIQLTASILLKRTVIMVSMAPEEMVKSFGMFPASDLQSALDLAGNMLGDQNAPIAVLPEAASMIIKQCPNQESMLRRSFGDS